MEELYLHKFSFNWNSFQPIESIEGRTFFFFKTKPFVDGIIDSDTTNGRRIVFQDYGRNMSKSLLTIIVNRHVPIFFIQWENLDDKKNEASLGKL